MGQAQACGDFGNEVLDVAALTRLERAVEKVVGEVEAGEEDQIEKPPPRLIDRVRARPVASLALLALIVIFFGPRMPYLFVTVQGLQRAFFSITGSLMLIRPACTSARSC